MISGRKAAHDPRSRRHPLVRRASAPDRPANRVFPNGWSPWRAARFHRRAGDLRGSGRSPFSRDRHTAGRADRGRSAAEARGAQHRHCAGSPAPPCRTGKRWGCHLAQLDCHRSPGPLHGPALGRYGTIDLGERFEVKRIGVKPGTSLSLPKHHPRAEHRIVVKGPAEVKLWKDVSLLAESQSNDTRWARYTACTIPANVNWKCPRCSRAGTSAKTTSCGCRTPMAALAESGRNRERGLMPCSLCTPSAAFAWRAKTSHALTLFAASRQPLCASLRSNATHSGTDLRLALRRKG